MVPQILHIPICIMESGLLWNMVLQRMKNFTLIVPPERDLTLDEALFIVEAWTQMAGEGDFDIETSNSNHRQQGSRNFDNSPDIVSEVTEQVIKDMGKFIPTGFLDKINEGWRWGLTTPQRIRPPLKDWDNSTESFLRRTPEYDDTDTP